MRLWVEMVEGRVWEGVGGCGVWEGVGIRCGRV